MSRMIHRIYAWLFGYFWLPCPICGEYFGGHESDGGFIMTSWNGGQGICRKCEKPAEKYNLKWMSEHPIMAENDEC